MTCSHVVGNPKICSFFPFPNDHIACWGGGSHPRERKNKTTKRRYLSFCRNFPACTWAPRLDLAAVIDDYLWLATRKNVDPMKSILLLVDNDVRTYCDETEKYLDSAARGNGKAAILNIWSAKLGWVFACWYLRLIGPGRRVEFRMAGTLAQARVQLQNAESSILFMQQEHAKTLQGLYAEINKLQKKCGGMDRF